ncbi:MAG: hypothetical protein ABR537_05050 [Gemmatimonadales bacterium]
MESRGAVFGFAFGLGADGFGVACGSTAGDGTAAGGSGWCDPPPQPMSSAYSAAIGLRASSLTIGASGLA